MSIPSQQTTLSVALVGNPNTGKSTLFSALVGIRQRVGNYPGVTVEKKTGRMSHGDAEYEVVDLPGLYSLAPRSRDEMVAVDVLLGRPHGSRPVDAVVCIVDAGNLQRNFYLLSQVLELGLPTVVAVNMLDIARSRGVTLDLPRLEQQLGVPVVAIQANRRIGVPDLKAALGEVAAAPRCPPQSPLPDPFAREVTALESRLAKRGVSAWLVHRLVLDSNGYLERLLLGGNGSGLRAELHAVRHRLAQAGCAVPEIETTARHDWARRVLDGVVQKPDRYRVTATDRIDRLLTHRFWGTLVFAALMVLVFQAVFAGAKPLMEWIDATFALAGDRAAARLPEGALRGLLIDGLIGGVGGVLVFLPQILILFLFIAVLEDCGYMARAAFLMDRLMARVGLSGKSFIPMLSSCACAIPGIMAARVIENERDRLTTILVAPLLTCSARLLVHTLLIAAFIPDRPVLGGLLNLQGLTLTALYLLGIVMAVIVALVLKKTLLRGQTPPFVMDLPSYQWPSPRAAVLRMVERGLVFLRTAGTVILAVSILVWAALYFPRNTELIEAQPHIRQLRAELDTLGPDDVRRAPLAAELKSQIAGEQRRRSTLARFGRLIEPVVRPLGWDWRIGCAVVASFPAREIVVATLGVIYNLGEDADATSPAGAARFRARLRAATIEGSDPPQKVFNVPVALSLMVFFALCAQCAATLAVIRRETNSLRWPAFAFAYMTVLAYVGALLTYQIGMWIAS